MIAEAIILFTALALAVLRSLPGPVFFPIRALAIAYADFFRGVPTILVIALLGFGAPALAIEGIPTSTTFWGIVSLVLIYTAYVSEVYRAGIESVHPSQEAAARSLGLTRGQALTSVVLPQAVRRVIPPLLNDFIGLQKDTALVGHPRLGRGVQAGADRRLGRLQLHQLPRRGDALRRDHDPARALHRLARRTRPAQAAGGRPRVSAVEIENLHKSFGKNEVLRGIDLEVAEHEVVCLIGASGSGKSTLLRCVNLLEPVDAGRIVVQGEEITARGVDVNRIRRGIGIVFQAYNLFPHMSVLENVTLAPRKALGTVAARGRRAGDRAARPLRARRQARRLPRPALGRPAAARRDRARARDAAAR